jgi:hypothetical protein
MRELITASSNEHHSLSGQGNGNLITPLFLSYSQKKRKTGASWILRAYRQWKTIFAMHFTSFGFGFYWPKLRIFS